MTTPPSTEPPPSRVPERKVRMARALVNAAQRRGTRESADIEAIARMKISSD